jgi:hypothetical protein
VVRVSGPLLSVTASGKFGGVGYFTTNRGTPSFAWGPRKQTRHGEELEFWRCLFRVAHGEWMKISPTPHQHTVGGRTRTYWYRVPRWPAFWSAFVAEHREGPCPPVEPPPPQVEQVLYDGSYNYDGTWPFGPIPA